MDDFFFDPSDLPRFTAIRTFEFHERVDSTSNRVKELLRQPVLPELPCLVVARHQTAGRGRGGKSWWSGNGALLMSLGFELETIGLHRDNLPLLSLAAAFSILETVQDHVPRRHDIALHWPNDVYLDGRKISGVLLEAPTARHVVVGIGINVNNRLVDIPAKLREHFEKHPIASLIDLIGETIDHPTLLKRLLFSLHENIEKIVEENRAGFMDEIGRRCIQVGRDVSITQGDVVLRGRCLGVAPDGALRLETKAGERRIRTGIVHES